MLSKVAIVVVRWTVNTELVLRKRRRRWMGEGDEMVKQELRGSSLTLELD
jgi:hypothetical protein